MLREDVCGMSQTKSDSLAARRHPRRDAAIHHSSAVISCFLLRFLRVSVVRFWFPITAMTRDLGDPYTQYVLSSVRY